MSIVLKSDVHESITRKMRNAIPYKNQTLKVLRTDTATPQQIWDATKKVYQELGMSEYIDLLKKQLIEAGHNLDW